MGLRDGLWWSGVPTFLFYCFNYLIVRHSGCVDNSPLLNPLLRKPELIVHESEDLSLGGVWDSGALSGPLRFPQQKSLALAIRISRLVKASSSLLFK